MSSDKNNNRKRSPDNGFIRRFIEVCGTSEAVKIQRLLNISYQAAKNYLRGRMPDTSILLTLSERTPYSIHWLLTGRGKKFVDDHGDLNTPVSAGQFEQSVRRICVEVINEMNGRKEPTLPKIVVLQPEDILSEKAVENAVTLTDGRPE
jgi:hypothetical protein